MGDHRQAANGRNHLTNAERGARDTEQAAVPRSYANAASSPVRTKRRVGHADRVFRVPHAAYRIILLGILLEAALLLGLVRPLWLFGPRGAITTDEPLATLLGNTAAGLLAFVSVLLVWVGGYAAALWCVLGWRRPLTKGTRQALLWLPVILAGTLLFVLPASSKDVYHYVMEGRILSAHGGNPLTLPPAAFPDDPLYGVMSSWETTPSRYGPLWGVVAGGVALVAGESLTAMLLGFKLVSVVSLFGAAVLMRATARRIRPDLALPAYVLIAWNPLALYEAGANAHNDLLMVFFTALALYLAARGNIALALPALALGGLVKYVVLLLAPLLLADHGLRTAAWRKGSRNSLASYQPSRPFYRCAFPATVCTPHSALLGGVLAAVLAILLYLPFWEGMQTFAALRSAAGDMGSSPGWMLRQALKHRLGWEGARPVVMAVMTALFAAGYTVLLWRGGLWRWLRRALQPSNLPAQAQPPGRIIDAAHPPLRAVDTGLLSMMLYLCTVSWWLWPWYALWLLPPAALLANRRLGLLAAAVTCAALLAYIPINFRIYFWGEVPTDHMPLYAFLTMFGLSAAAALVLWLGRRAQRLAWESAGP